ncbi:MAG TPA: phosphatidate cytidylyltransferase [Thermomicrobiales bacterium]|jgi:CDP-diglyceride synthetase|nr:phosphatidate cytidylyltransferase [Thermomicrobiales bacterium]
MRDRLLGSVGVVVVGLVALLLGGPVYVAVMLAIGLVAYHEFRRLAQRIGLAVSHLGYGFIIIGALAGWMDNRSIMFAVVTLAAMLPLTVGVLRAGRHPVLVGPESLHSSVGLGGWAATACASLFITIPTMFGISLREREAGGEAEWLQSLSEALALGWDGRPTGLGWIATFTLIGWLSDTGAYLIGRRWGRHPLAPTVSPKKTVEGAIGGMIGSALAAAAGILVFNLDCPLWLGLLIGVVLGALGMLGDLGESLIKRQAGVKDSGTLIPGHGGILDRFDAMYVILAAGWFAVEFVNWYVSR